MTNTTKKKNKRWGRKFVDRRKLSVYNRQLVKRGEYFLDLDWVEGWDSELQAMNMNKVGKPYHFPNSLIQLQAIWHVKQIPYRMIQGMTLKLTEIANLPDYNHYSTSNRRVNKLEVKLDLPVGNNLTLFSDGTGMQAIEGGEYLREKYGKKNRRWVQIIILGDPVTKEPVSFEVNIVSESEPKSTKKQAEQLLEKGVDISALGGDGAMDSMLLWQWLEEQKITPIIKPDKNAIEDSDSPTRNEHVKERNKKGHKKWSRKHKYGFRWPATEGIFSAVKRIFGEQLSSKSEIGLIQEAKIKFWAYQKMKRYGEA